MAETAQLRVGNETYSIHRLDALQHRWDVARLPYTLRILLENVLRNGTDAEAEAVAGWASTATEEPSHEISCSPARVLLHDFTGGYKVNLVLALVFIAIATTPFWTVRELKTFR